MDEIIDNIIHNDDVDVRAKIQYLAREIAADIENATPTTKQSNNVVTSDSEIGRQILEVLSELDIEGIEIRQAAIDERQLMIVN